jgi:hypothetical protein
MSLGDYPVGTQSLDLSLLSFHRGIYKVFVKAVGKPSVKNTMSDPVTFNNGIWSVFPPTPN